MLLKLTSMTLRMTALVAKLGVLFYLAKILTPSDFVSYGVFTVTIAYLQYVIGLDIYNYANREVALCNSNVSLFKIIAKQYSFYFCFYACILVLLLILVFINQLNLLVVPSWLLLCGLILITEHYFNECYRLWVFKTKAIFSAFLYFIKSLLFFVILAYLNNEIGTITIDVVLQVWLFANFVAILISTIRLNVVLITIKLWNLDSIWLKKALTFSVPLVLSALCSKAVFTFDRSLADFLLDIQTAATYVLLMSIFFAINSLLDSVFFVFKAPILVKSANGSFSKEFAQFFKSGIGVILLCSFSFIPSFYISQIFFSDKVEGATVFTFLLIGVVFLLFNISQIYHYGLYAKGGAKHIRDTQFGGLLLCAGTFIIGLAVNIASTIEFFIFSVGVYCFSVAYLKRKALKCFLKESI
jgi:hypothetical protein